MNERLPTVCHITDLAPENPATLGTLSYKNLASAALKYEHADTLFLADAWQAEQGSMEERNAAENAASAYLSRIAHRIITAPTPAQHDLWAARFTNASIDIYGQPDPHEAKRVIHELQLRHIGYQEMPHVDQHALEYLLDFYRSVVGEPGGFEQTPYDSLWPQIVTFMNTRFKPLFDIFDAVAEKKEWICPEDSKLILADMLKWLSVNHNPAWARWKVKEKNDATMAAYPETEEFTVGMLTPPCLPILAKGGIIHELLHALRTINGRKFNENLAIGLAGFRTYDEGFANLVGYAVAGMADIGPEILYSNIALALGSIDENPVSRSKLLRVAYNSSKVGWQATGGQGLLPLSRKRGNFSFTTRIFRGGRGDDFGTIQPVFTKDIMYHEGYIRAERYFQKMLSEGKSMDEIFDYLTLGGFNPEDSQHVEYVEKVTGQRL